MSKRVHPNPRPWASVFRMSCFRRGGSLSSVALLLSFLIEASGELAVGQVESSRLSQRSYCGVLCLHVAMRLTGLETDLQDLLKPAYVGSPRGSSLGELRRAAEDHGLHAMPLENMSIRDVAASPYYIILHVKREAASERYDHFELFLGTKEGQAILFNPPDQVELTPLHRLAQRWSGRGMLLSAGSVVDLGEIAGRGRLRLGIGIVSVMVGVIAFRAIRKRWFDDGLSRQQLLATSFLQCGILAALAVATGLLHHSVTEEGFLAHTNATAGIREAHLGGFLPKLDSTAVRRMLRGGSVTLVDAGWSRDFNAVHLEGAINIEPNASQKQCREALMGIPKDACVLLYCRNAECPFAVLVAKKLYREGFFNLALFKGGWEEWERAARDGNAR